MTSSTSRYSDYDPWAWLYNRSEAHLALQGLMPLLDKLLFPHLPENGQILDVCCGTGQVSKQLIQQGYQVTGLDGSEKMLHYARENAPQGKFLLDDARSFTLPSTFDAAISTDSSLNHIMSLDELQQVFQNVYAALKQGGRFLFDLGLENRYRNIEVNDGELQADYAWTVGETYDADNKTGTFTITLFQPADSDASPSLTNSDKRSHSIPQRLKRFVYNRVLRVLRPGLLPQLIDKYWQSLPMTFTAKPYSQAEVRAALEVVGFTQVEVYDFRARRATPQRKDYAYFLAQKPSGQA
ncbi:class I SAM-dependent methyltransferase [Acaryochloris marina]|uniref:Methyltransferase domain-containing protein n=1 Tax=Acaryochloris marina (strain MBIC 11017) TaxID=329726 RepID=A8ZKN9_ACAM1|nr:class I SAM-dependent methyltransferase [Acaryochloris marina]ABW31357.1 conserved hypothetical protein [Acaryochloris marina MBIC11017]